MEFFSMELSKTKLKEKITGNLSGAQKLCIGLAVVLLLLALCIIGGYLLKARLFEKNPRFTLKQIEIVPPEGYVLSYWNSEFNREKRCRELASELRIDVGNVNLFELDPGKLRTKMLKEHSEIEKLSIRRVLPDRLEFTIYERVPIANIGPCKADPSAPASLQLGKRVPRYLDDTGTVISADRCQQITLPMVIDMTDKEIGGLKPGDVVRSAPVRLALDLIKLVTTDPAYKDIVIRTILLVSFEKSIQCNITFRDKEHEYIVILPYPVSYEKLRTDVMGRLLPVLREKYSRRESNLKIDMRFEKQVVVTKLK